jgi:hypothetical protein
VSHSAATSRRCDVVTEQRRNRLRPSTAEVLAVLNDALDEPCFRLATALLLIAMECKRVAESRGGGSSPAESSAKDASL